MATVEEDGTLEEDGMSDSGYLESQANNMDQITVRQNETGRVLHFNRAFCINSNGLKAERLFNIKVACLGVHTGIPGKQSLAFTWQQAIY